MITSFDRLNELNIERKSMPFDQYFGEMELSEVQIEDRKKVSRKLYELMLTLFEMVSIGVTASIIDWDYLEKWLAVQIQIIAADVYADGDDFFMGFYPTEKARQIIDTTRRNTEASENVSEGSKERNKAYALSKDRGMFIAENEANTLYNRSEYVKALRAGYKYKTWRTKADKHVRKTHVVVEGKTIPIESMFEVGMAQMLYPKDELNAGDFPEEIVNCRCTVKYSK